MLRAVAGQRDGAMIQVTHPQILGDREQPVAYGISNCCRVDSIPGGQLRMHHIAAHPAIRVGFDHHLLQWTVACELQGNALADFQRAAKQGAGR